MFRQLVFVTDARFGLHNLPSKPKGPFRYAAGDFKKRRTPDDSLVIVRQNTGLGGGSEHYLSPHLLHGVVPSVILEAFQLWHGKFILFIFYFSLDSLY